MIHQVLNKEKKCDCKCHCNLPKCPYSHKSKCEHCKTPKPEKKCDCSCHQGYLTEYCSVCEKNHKPERQARKGVRIEEIKTFYENEIPEDDPYKFSDRIINYLREQKDKLNEIIKVINSR